MVDAEIRNENARSLYDGPDDKNRRVRDNFSCAEIASLITVLCFSMTDLTFVKILQMWLAQFLNKKP